MVFDKKKEEFRTPDLNYIIAEIARHTGDFAVIKKGLSSFFKPKSLSAGWTGLEPATSAVTGRHSNQLNYQPLVENQKLIYCKKNYKTQYQNF